MDSLRETIVARGVAARFVGLVGATLANTETIRTTRRPRVYLDGIEREGELAAEMALLLMRPYASPRLVEFFRAIASPANLVDKVIDARADFRRGELAMRPGIWLHARLVRRMLRRVPRAAARHPHRLWFVAWSRRWLPRL